MEEVENDPRVKENWAKNGLIKLKKTKHKQNIPTKFKQLYALIRRVKYNKYCQCNGIQGFYAQYLKETACIVETIEKYPCKALNIKSYLII